MKIFDLGIAWNWQPDNEFVQELNDLALKEGLHPYLIHAYNFYGTLKDIADGAISFSSFLNRTIADGSPLNGVGDFLKKREILFINHPDESKKSSDRSVMHLEFIHHNIPVPFTVFVDPEDDTKTIESKIKHIPKPFIFKTAHRSSDNASIWHAHSLEEVLCLRERNGNGTYIAQKKIYPVNLENKCALFRVVYCLGEIISYWWHPEKNIADLLTQNDTEKFGLPALSFIAKDLASASKLDFFSAEIAVDIEKRGFVIDYVNDHPDMQRKSKITSGVPDEIVDKVLKKIVAAAKIESHSLIDHDV